MSKPTAEQIRRRFAKASMTDLQRARVEKIRAAITQCAETCVGEVRGSAEQSRALNKLDEAFVLFGLAVARNG